MEVVLVAILLFSILFKILVYDTAKMINNEKKFIKDTKGKLRKHPVFNRKNTRYNFKLYETTFWENPEFKTIVEDKDKEDLHSGAQYSVDCKIVFTEDGDWNDFEWLVPIKKGDEYKASIICINPDMSEYQVRFSEGSIREQYLERKYRANGNRMVEKLSEGLTEKQIEDLIRGVPVVFDGDVYRIHPSKTGTSLEELKDTDLLVHEENDSGVV